MRQTKGAIGNLLNRYKAVLKKCHLLNTFGSLAVAGMLVMGGAGVAQANDLQNPDNMTVENSSTNLEDGTVLVTEGSPLGGAVIWINGTDPVSSKDVPGKGLISVDGNGATLYGGMNLGENAQARVDFVGVSGKDTTISGAAISGTNITKDDGSASWANKVSSGITASLGEGQSLTVSGSQFTDNTVTLKGIDNGGGLEGALLQVDADGTGTKLVLQDTKFTENTYSVQTPDVLYNGTYGGIVSVGDDDATAYDIDVTMNNVTISDNTVSDYKSVQGAGYWQYGGTLNATNLTVTGNTASVEKEEGVTINGTPSSLGGAFALVNVQGVIADSEFSNNTNNHYAASYGGTIFVSQDSNVTFNNDDFRDNTASGQNSMGGAIYTEGGVTVNGGEFTGNKAGKYGGAISGNLEGTATVNVTDATFKENHSSAGGAIALWTNGTSEAGSHSISGRFEGNTADRKGGAIVILANHVGDYKVDANISGEFIDNTAGESGGAIHSESSELTIADASFTGNKADSEGGAIYNNDDSSLTFTGTNTFSGNTAASQGNDIHNSGAVTVASGRTSLGSGYSQDKGSLEVNGGATLESLGTMDISGGTATFKDGSTFVVNGSNITEQAAIKLSGTADLDVAEGANLLISDAVDGQSYNIVDNEGSGTADEWKNIASTSNLVDLKMDENGDVQGTAKDAASVLPGLSGDMAAQVNGITGIANRTNSEYAGVRFLARATDSRFLGNDPKAAVSTIESAARIAFAGAVPQMTKMASDAATNAVVNRLGFANPDNGAKAMNVDGKLVDDKALGLALWIAPLWSNQTGFGMEAGNLDYGYNANLGGVSLGADYTWANNIRAGLMFNIGGGYAESAGGDLSETTNSMTFWGVGAYGGWEYNNFAVMADVSYTSTWNSVDQDVDHRMGMGDLEADIQASAISAGLRFEYKLETQYLDLIPHVGARYMSINTWGYDVDSSGGTVLEGDGFQQNIWTFPVGITFSKELEMNSGWHFKPSVDFTVIPAAGDIKAKEDVRFTGLDYSTEIETQMMDYFTWQGGVGLEFGNDNMSVGVNYTLQAGQNSTGHGVFGMFRYEF